MQRVLRIGIAGEEKLQPLRCQREEKRLFQTRVADLAERLDKVLKIASIL